MQFPKPTVLATDLDGTFIPLPNEPSHHAALKELTAAFAAPERTLVFATGRHLESITEAIASIPLPRPDWIIADVGVSIYRAGPMNFERVLAYAEHLRNEVGGVTPQDAAPHLEGIAGMQKQPPVSQSTFKLSYTCAPERLNTCVEAVETILRGERLALATTGSIDPEGATGLIDVLPAAASKHAALQWLARHAGFDLEEMVYAGDSGNDRPALTSGGRAILVGNAPESLANEIQATLADRGASEALYRARASATAGVLEGCRHFGLV